MEFSRPEYQSGLLFPSLGDLSNPGIEPRSPQIQADSLPAELRRKPKNTGVSSLSLLQRIFLTYELNRGGQVPESARTHVGTSGPQEYTQASTRRPQESMGGRGRAPPGQLPVEQWPGFPVAAQSPVSWLSDTPAPVPG